MSAGKRLVGMAAIAVTLSSAACGATHESAAEGKVKVHIALGNNGQDVSNGGVSGRGQFTASGAIADHGSATTYRTVKGILPGGVVTLRIVTAGKKGDVTYRVRIDTGKNTSRWEVISGTKVYENLHGHGFERENPDHTVSTLIGTASS